MQGNNRRNETPADATETDMGSYVQESPTMVDPRASFVGKAALLDSCQTQGKPVKTSTGFRPQAVATEEGAPARTVPEYSYFVAAFHSSHALYFGRSRDPETYTCQQQPDLSAVMVD